MLDPKHSLNLTLQSVCNKWVAAVQNDNMKAVSERLKSEMEQIAQKFIQLSSYRKSHLIWL